LGRLGVEFFERRLGFLDDRVIALGLGELDQLGRVLVALLDALVAADQVVKPIACADQLLRCFRIVPELGIVSPAV
jgi:hypothetical protein